MLKTLKFILAGACGLLAFTACNDEVEVSPNESYFASEATITSSDSNVTITGNEAEVTFKVEGGTVTFTVDCGCEWTATSYKPEYFTASTTSTSVTITAAQNTVENELAGVVSLMTAGEGIQFARIQVYQSAYGAPEITVSTTEWNAPAVGALTTEISVTASDEWTAESADAWLTVEKTTTGISLTATENETAEERSTKVTLTCTDGVSTAYEYVTVNQDALAYITLSNDTISFSNEENSASVTVESNFDWDYSYDTSNGWLTITRSGDVLTITAAANETADEREETVTFTAGDGAENVAEGLLTISQIGANVDDMIFTYTITEANTTTQLPLYGTVDCTVDWGDDSNIETITNQQPTHTYTAAGEYDVIISGTVTALYSKNISSSAPLLTAVKQWGKTGLTTMEWALGNCSNLASLPEITGDSFADVTSFVEAFDSCSSLTKIPSGIFSNCPKVTSFNFAFYKCSKITEIPEGFFDNTSEVKDFGCAFYGCTALEKIPSGLFNNCSNVEDFSQIFRDCSNITEIPSGLFDNCPNVTSFYHMCDGCSSLKVIPGGLFDNCTKVTDFSYSFFNCTTITEIPAGLFKNCSAVTTFSCTFSGCSSLTTIHEGLFDNCTGVTTFDQVFYQTPINEIPDGLFDSFTEVTNFQNVFRGCTNLKSIPVDLFANNKKVTNFSYAFYGDTNLTGESPYDVVDGVKIHLYERSNYTSIYTAPKTITRCFYNCTGLDDYYSIPSDWGGGGE